MNKMKISRKRLKNIKKYQTEIMKVKNKVTKLKNSVKRFNSRLEHRKKLNKFKDSSFEISNQRAKRMNKT